MSCFKKMLVSFVLILLGLQTNTLLAKSPKTPAPVTSKATLFLDWFLNPHQATIVIGIEKGFFKEQGIDLQIKSSAAGDEGIKQVAAGQADFAFSGQPRHIMHVAKGMPLTHIATIFDHSMEGIATMGKKGDIRTLADLKGKKIGHASTGTGFTMVALRAILEKHNIKPEEVTFVQVGNGIAQSLLSGRVDAVANVQLTYEFPDIQRFNPDAAVYTHGQAGIPEYDSSIIVANSKKLNADLVKRFVKALTKAANYVRDHSDEAWTIFANHKPELDTPTNKKSWELVVPHFTRNPGFIDLKRYDALIPFLYQYNALKGELPKDIKKYTHNGSY